MNVKTTSGTVLGAIALAIVAGLPAACEPIRGKDAAVAEAVRAAPRGQARPAASAGGVLVVAGTVGDRVVWEAFERDVRQGDAVGDSVGVDLDPGAMGAIGSDVDACAAGTIGVDACAAGTIGVDAVADGGATRPVLADVRPVTREGWFQRPRFSPDGRQLLVTGARHTGLWVLSAAGRGTPWQVAAGEGIGLDARWAARGIESRTRDGRQVRIDLDGVRVRPAGPGASGVADNAGAAVHAQVFDDGLHLRTPEGDRVVAPVADRWFDPVPSPDGRRVAVNGLATGLWVHEVAAGRTVAVGPGNHPAWLPDGSGFVFDVTQDDGVRFTSGDLWFWDAAAGRSLPLTATPDRIETSPAVSPDGTRLAFEAGGVIYTARIER